LSRNRSLSGKQKLLKWASQDVKDDEKAFFFRSEGYGAEKIRVRIIRSWNTAAYLLALQEIVLLSISFSFNNSLNEESKF
jgi:hypothetical protein